MCYAVIIVILGKKMVFPIKKTQEVNNCFEAQSPLFLLLLLPD